MNDTSNPNPRIDRAEVRRRQLAAIRGLATTNLYPTGDPTHAPNLDAEQDKLRQLRREITTDQVLVDGLHVGHGALIVDRWAGKPTPGWRMTSYDLELESDGRPFGAFVYTNDTDPDVRVRVGVQWHHPTEELWSVALDVDEPRPADNAEPDVLRDLERDARGRVGALLGAYASIGSYVCSIDSDDAVLAAAGLPREPEK